MKKLLFVLLMTSSFQLWSQQNVRSWYDHGQVWVVWENPQSFNGEITIYTNTELSEEIENWQETGRLFSELTYPASARMHIGIEDLHYKIPDGNGGIYTLKENEGLFVETIRESKIQYYLIQNCVEGPCNLPVVQSAISNQINLVFDINDKPQPHLQASTEISPGQFINLFYLWTEGRDDHWNGLDGFPIMGNQFTNGWPHVFAVWNGLNADISGPVPAVHWLHGGSGNFSQYFPDRRPEINNNADEGLVICHNDDFMRYVLGQLVFNESNSWWFGWSKDHNPFDKSHNGPSEGDTIVNYTQRRIKFINDWLIDQGMVDEHRVAIQGYSVGSAGTVGMIKTYPEMFSSASIFSCSHQGPDDDNFGSLLLGNAQFNLPTNLKDRIGKTLHIHDLYDLKTFTSFEDLPLMRSWHGKNDINPTMMWDKEFVDEARHADSTGLGYQLFWDERTHPIVDWNTHWTNGITPSHQSQKDNTAFLERYRNDQSYPVFYNYRLYDIDHNDPGDGSRGTGAMGVGDDWGTWGGYHDYDVKSVIDLEDTWSSVVFLTGESGHPVDNYPGSPPCVETDFTIRRIQNFKFAPLAEFSWRITNRQGQTIQSGKAFADPEGRPRIEGIIVCKEPMWATITLFKEEQERCEVADVLQPIAGEYCQEIDVDGVLREFITIVPENYDDSEAHPLLFVFHPGGGGMVNFRYGHIVGDGTGREELFTRAEAEGMIVIIPQATFNDEINNTVWNTFENYPQDSSWVDDLSFVEAMLAQHRSILNIDDERIYACGFSKGGDFSQFLGSQMACTFAGVAAVGSSAGEALELGSPELEFNPIGEVPVPTLIMKGYLDFKRPFGGGLNNSGNFTTSAFQDFYHWMDNNGCDTLSLLEEVVIPDTTILYTNTDCDRSEVQFYECIKLPHIWPDSIHNVGINANRLFIDFLKRQVNNLCQNTAVTEKEIDLGIFPNPTTNNINIRSTLNSFSYSIYSYSGQFIMQGVSTGAIELKDISQGFYFIRIYDNGQSYSRTFIKM